MGTSNVWFLWSFILSFFKFLIIMYDLTVLMVILHSFFRRPIIIHDYVVSFMFHCVFCFYYRIALLTLKQHAWLCPV